MPAWEVSFPGHTLTLSVLIPFAVTRRVCLGLQRKDNDLLEHGMRQSLRHSRASAADYRWPSATPAAAPGRGFEGPRRRLGSACAIRNAPRGSVRVR